MRSRRRRPPVVAVSPFVGGEVLKGPTRLFCEHAGIEASAAGLLDAYAGLLDGLVADEPVEGIAALEIDTLMDSAERRRARGREDPGVCGLAARRRS